MRLATLGGMRLPNHSVRLMAGVLRDHGVDPCKATAMAEISPALLADPSGEVTGLQELAYQRAFCTLTQDQPALWIELGARYHMLGHAHSYYGLAMATSNSVREAVEQGLEFGDLWYTLAEGRGVYADGRLVGVRVTSSETPEELKRFTALRDLGAGIRVFGDLWGAPFPFDRLELPVPEADSLWVRRVLPDVPITYGAPYSGWYWSVSMEGRRPAQSDDLLHDFYRQKCLDVIEAARDARDPLHHLITLLEDSRGRLGVERAAQQLGQSARSLQRYLQSRGRSYREMVAVVRYRLACRQLTQTRAPISQIAMDVGYENISSFNYAFRRYAGMSPRDFRRGGASERKAQPLRSLG